MRNWIVGTIVALAPGMAPGMALAETVRVEAEGDVPAVMDALEAAVEGAGATIFARVDHAGGAARADMALDPAQLLIFGNPVLGTPAMQDDIEAGLRLPLKVLVYERDGQTWLAYEDPAADLSALPGISADAQYLSRMQAALNKLTARAAGAAE